MFEVILNIIKSFKKERYGLHIHLEKDGEVEYFLMHKKLSKNGVKVQNVISTTDFELLKKELLSKTPISIHISGNGVLIKHTKDNLDSSEDLFKNLFGDINPNQFYIHVDMQFEDKWVGIVRKEAINEILSEIAKLNVFILGVSIIPPTKVENIQLSNSHDEVIFGKELLFFNNGLTNIEPNTKVEEYELQNSSISSKYLPSFYISIPSIKGQHSKYFDSEFCNEKNYMLYRISNRLIGFSIVFLILLFSLNYSAIGYFNNKISQQTGSLNQSELSLKKINELKNKRNKKRTFIESQYVTKNVHHCKLINEIASVVPENIVISSLVISPIKFKTNKVNIEQNLILIEGLSYDGVGVTEFIKYLKGANWVESIKLVNYKKNKDENNSKFQLRIDLKKGGFNE